MSKQIYYGGAAIVVIVLIVLGGHAFLGTSTQTQVSNGSSTLSVVTTTINQTTTPQIPGGLTPESALHVNYVVGVSDAVMIIDSSGKRAGQDPKTGVVYNEIPGSNYVSQ